MNITIVGCGNIGTQFAVHCAAKGHNVIVFTSKPDKISKSLKIFNHLGEQIYEGKIHCATNNNEIAFKCADLLFVTVPSFCIPDYAKQIIPHLKKEAMICLVPGSGGGEFAFKKAIENGNTVFGLQRVPSVARLVEYGKSVCASGYRDRLYLSSIPESEATNVADIVSNIFDMPCSVAGNYLNLTLTPSNPILHTTRLKTIFKNYNTDVFYNNIPLFYEDWDDESSELLLKCDEELQMICKALNCFDLTAVKSLKDHYESETAEKLTKKISSIQSFKGIKTPSVKTDKGYIPDFSSRYFKADFPFGLQILIQLANMLNIYVPNMLETYNWYKPFVKDNKEFSFSEYGINNVDSLIDFYKKDNRRGHNKCKQ